MKGIRTSTYQDLLDNFDEFDSLLSELGITSNSTRLHEAASLVKNLDMKVKLTKEGKVEVGSVPEKYLHGLWILSEINHIMKSVGGFDKEILTTKLKKITKGPLILKNETSINNEARNTMFELVLASDLLMNGYKTGLDDPNPDIKVVLPKKTYLFECKRVFSEKKVERQIGDAKRQLEKQLAEDENSHGVIAISIPRIYIGKGERLVANSWEEAMSFLNETMQKFVEKHKRFWKNISNKRIVAVVFHLSCPALIEGVSAVTYYTRTNVHDDNTFDVFKKDFNRLPKVKQLLE